MPSGFLGNLQTPEFCVQSLCSIKTVTAVSLAMVSLICPMKVIGFSNQARKTSDFGYVINAKSYGDYVSIANVLKY